MAEEVQSQSLLGAAVYPKAHVLNRLIAKGLDLILVAAADRLVPPVGWLAGLAYVLIADGFAGGQSVGKRLIGLQTLMPRSRDVAGFKDSIIRNLPLALAYLLFPLPYIGWFLAAGIVGFEMLLLLGNDQGIRLGDELAHTQVVDGGQLDLRD